MDELITHAHDKFFKTTFSDVEIAKDFMRSYLPKDVLDVVDLNTLVPQKDSHVDKKLKEQFSDLLFRVDINKREGYIYFLFEHKSYNDKMAVIQLLRYMVEIWEEKIVKEKAKELPVIMPLLVYHDKGNWTANTKLSGWIGGYSELPEALKKYIPDYEYILHDLSDYTKEQVKVDARTKIVIEMLNRGRYTTKEDRMELAKEAFELLVTMRESESVSYIVSACIKYLLSISDNLTEKDLERIAGSISVEGSELVMTVAEQLRQEGEQKGIKEGLKITAKKAIIKGYSVEDIMDLTGLTEKEIEEVRKEMLKS